MLAGNRLFVPSYQRAYSWDTELTPGDTRKQTNVFLADLETHLSSGTRSPYYFGHFLFEEKGDRRFGIIDGQQRLTTIVIFLTAVFARLKSIRALNEEEIIDYEDTIARKSIHRLETVDYDSQIFKDYIIDHRPTGSKRLETESAKRIVRTLFFFKTQLLHSSEETLLQFLDIVLNATCTTHQVKDEAEAVQMFIFQNNRGKAPSNLEIIKAQFLFHILLHGGEEKGALAEEIRKRFEHIYKAISSIEYRIDEDEILLHTLKVYFNSLGQSGAVEKINNELAGPDRLLFIKSFTHALSDSFDYLSDFFEKHEKEHLAIHSLITLGGIGIAIPFLIKAYSFGLAMEQICTLCTAFESVVLRNRLIGTRADITPRLTEEFKEFTVENPCIQAILERIGWLKVAGKEHWWWAYWNNAELERALQGGMNHGTAKFLLWKYELDLEGTGKAGYLPFRFTQIIDPELEHIAPKTENPASGYAVYDQEFRNEYLDSLGNYLLLSKSHNCSVGNKPFAEKRSTYNHLAQQREIQNLTAESLVWSKELIKERKGKIIEFLLRTI